MNDLEIGQLIELEGNRYQIVGTDLSSLPNTVGYKKWDYLLKRTDNGGWRRVTKEEMKNATIVAID